MFNDLEVLEGVKVLNGLKVVEGLKVLDGLEVRDGRGVLRVLRCGFVISIYCSCYCALCQFPAIRHSSALFLIEDLDAFEGERGVRRLCRRLVPLVVRFKNCKSLGTTGPQSRASLGRC